MNYEASQIELSQNEIELFKLLNNALVFNDVKQDVKLMATGAWLRDKLLEKDDCSKISVTFASEKDGLTSESIAAMVQEYQIWEGGYEQSILKSVTNQFSYNGIEVTFNKVSSPTLLQDAISKDFTMNALYFNLDDLSVMDPLGYGMKDIMNKIINTCAANTLEADPFKMLRAISMASALDFDISQSIVDQIRDTEKMRPLFDEKVSKEKVGDELNRMFSDKKGGIKALSMMTDLGILENYVTLMCSPDSEQVPDYCFLIGKFMEEDTATIADDSI